MKINPGLQSGIYFFVQFLVFAAFISSQLGNSSVYLACQLVHTLSTILYIQIVVLHICFHWKPYIVFLLHNPMILGNKFLTPASLHFLAADREGLLIWIHILHFSSHPCHQIVIAFVLVLIKQFPSFLDKFFIDFA